MEQVAKKPKLLTLTIITSNSKILLGMKKKGFGEGKWNGFGGKVEAGESFEECARREVLEETGLILNSIEKCGVIYFSFQNEVGELEVHLFRSESFIGDPVETEEMIPSWFHKDEIPYEMMWIDDPLWLPQVLAGATVEASFVFQDESTLLSSKLEFKESSSVQPFGGSVAEMENP